MRVLSLFDGISAGRVALERAGIEVTSYYACEVDPYAIKIAQKNYPDTQQLGDVCAVSAVGIPEPIDLLIGGSPCQGFSFAGHQLNFDDPRSQLFFEFVRLWKECRPKYFLLENVKMKKESEAVITQILGVEPIEINSALVSAQNRKRLYWTNIPFNQNLEDRHLLLKDVLDSEGFVDRDKSYCLDASYYKGGNLKSYFEKRRRQLVFTNCLQVGEADLNGHDLIKRVYSINGKAPTLNTCSGGNREPKINTSKTTYRKLTPTECERLQTFPDGYTEGVSNTRRYHALGNSWTVEVVAHIFKGVRHGIL
tara:strand:- start:1565 stop:2491 length:927 start_codon:yes stop_codon:yes gene_type:complete